MLKRLFFITVFIIIIISSFSVEKIGLVYNGPNEDFDYIFNKVYKYADITIPPSGDYETLEINYNKGLYDLKYKNKTIKTDLENIDLNIKELLNSNARSVFIIADNFYISTEDSTKTSAFFRWDNEVKVNLQKDGINYEYVFNPPFGKRIFHIPNNFIEVEIIGDQDTIFLNGSEINIPKKVVMPPNIFEIYDGIETFTYDLTDYSSRTYYINLLKQNLYEKTETKIIKAYSIKSGVFLYGDPTSIWFPNEGDPVIVKSRFYSNYGNIENLNERYSFKGVVAYVYEYDNTVYIISSAGELVSMGTKELYKDFGRSPMNITVGDTYLELNTFKMEKYTINFQGGIYKNGNVYSIFYDMPKYEPKKQYSSDKYILEIKENIVNIYIK
ncbi:hypothetical protein [Geotoga petraea]|uniref:Uncharacterized protein n=1 Tax=Geotoga petraea TaxID=28234 RepID=A0A4Z0W3Q7_9BACT|nr:hypothetical protein [Geotoga petraea]TGG87522.1 hypothetical protein E4650_07190 [Geotoga petraea]